MAGFFQIVNGMKITGSGFDMLINGIKPNFRQYHDEDSPYYYDEQIDPFIDITDDVLTINGIIVNPADYETEEETKAREQEATRRVARHEDVGRLITSFALSVVLSILVLCVAIGLSAGGPSAVEE